MTKLYFIDRHGTTAIAGTFHSHSSPIFSQVYFINHWIDMENVRCVLMKNVGDDESSIKLSIINNMLWIFEQSINGEKTDAILMQTYCFSRGTLAVWISNCLSARFTRISRSIAPNSISTQFPQLYDTRQIIYFRATWASEFWYNMKYLSKWKEPKRSWKLSLGLFRVGNFVILSVSCLF